LSIKFEVEDIGAARERWRAKLYVEATAIAFYEVWHGEDIREVEPETAETLVEDLKRKLKETIIREIEPLVLEYIEQYIKEQPIRVSFSDRITEFVLLVNPTLSLKNVIQKLKSSVEG